MACPHDGKRGTPAFRKVNPFTGRGIWLDHRPERDPSTL